MTAEELEQLVSASPIETDIPCEACGYNLRGLSYTGRCPECGHYLERSLATWQSRMRLLLPPEPTWVRIIHEGAWISIATFVLLCGTVFVVPSNVEWYHYTYRFAPARETPVRALLLTIACVWWVLAWASAWRLTERERDRPSPGAFVAPVARWLITAHLLSPFLWAWATWSDPYAGQASIPVFLLLTTMLFGVLGAAALMVQIGQVFWRLRRRPAAIQAWVLAIVVPAGTVFATAAMRGEGTSSLSFMFNVPAYPYGIPAFLQLLVREIAREPVVVVMATPPVWVLCLMLRLLVVTRDAESINPAGHAERSSTNSRP
jgi:hypothetical protein